MKYNIRQVFGEETSQSIEGIVRNFAKINFTPEELAEQIKDYHELIRSGIHITAISEGNRELADKIKTANDIIENNKINAFKESVANGTHNEFLSKMHWMEKSSFLANIKMKFLSKNEPTTEEQRYQDIIKASINKDIEKEALSQGFATVEAWRVHNLKMFESKNSNSMIYEYKIRL